MNTVYIYGSIYKKYELRYTSNGQMTLEIVLQAPKQGNQKYGDRFSIKFWGDSAQAVNNLAEGAVMFIKGTLRNESWQDKKSQEWKHKTVITSQSYELLDAQIRPETADQGTVEPMHPSITKAQPAPRPVMSEDDIPF